VGVASAAGGAIEDVLFLKKHLLESTLTFGDGRIAGGETPRSVFTNISSTISTEPNNALFNVCWSDEQGRLEKKLSDGELRLAIRS
jgi:hypothetical protein